MLFKYENIDFDIGSNMTEEQAIRLFEPVVDIIQQHGVETAEIVVEDDDYAVIMIDGVSDEEYSDAAMQIASQIPEATGIETSLSDEDYGMMDAINLYL